jgi:predicted  nucleic acid-binding Zn-ribbon protein
MSGPADILRELHRLRRHTRDLQEQIDRGPKLLKAHQAKITRAEEALHEAQEALKKLKVSNHQKEVSLKTAHQQLAKYAEQLKTAGGTREYAALQTEIGTAKAGAQQLEDEILEGLSHIEDQTAKLPELETAIPRAKEEFATFERTTKERLATQATMLKETQQKIKEVEATLPEDVRAAYERVIQTRGADGMASVQNKNCGACYTGITAQNYNDLLVGRLVYCKACGRIVYLHEAALVEQTSE